MREEMTGKMLISRQSRRFSFIVKLINLLFPICTLTWLVNTYVSRRGKGINSRNESTKMFLLLVLLERFSILLAVVN